MAHIAKRSATFVSGEGFLSIQFVGLRGVEAIARIEAELKSAREKLELRLLNEGYAGAEEVNVYKEEV